jgi:hypothetical protein
MLDFQEMKGAHSGANMAQSIFETLRDMDLLEKVYFSLISGAIGALTRPKVPVTHRRQCQQQHNPPGLPCQLTAVRGRR